MESTTTQIKQTFKTNHNDIHQMVTDTIIQQLENGVIPWQKPWIGTNGKLPGLPVNFTTNKYYRGINILLLWSAAIEKNYPSDEWASFKQWQAKGEAIQKGEKGNVIVYYDTIEKEKDGEIQKIPFLKLSKVFNRTQLVSFDTTEIPENIPLQCSVEKQNEIEQFLSDTKADIEWHTGGACYIPSQNKIKIPNAEYFQDTATCTATEGYYSTIFHELTHWTGAEKRLNRTNGKKFGDNNYATEELVAEFGAAFLCAGFGIHTIEKGDHAGYIDSWLKVLKENKKCLFTAASEASKAYDYLHSLSID